MKRALAGRRGGRAFFDLTASDAAGNTTRVRGQITLQPHKPRR